MPTRVWRRGAINSAAHDAKASRRGETCMFRRLARRLGARSIGTVIVAGVTLWFAATAGAQTFRGTIVGTVVDSTQAPVPSAKVTAKNEATGITSSTLTDDAGQFNVPQLPLVSCTGPVEIA